MSARSNEAFRHVVSLRKVSGSGALYIMQQFFNTALMSFERKTRPWSQNNSCKAPRRRIRWHTKTEPGDDAPFVVAAGSADVSHSVPCEVADGNYYPAVAIKHNLLVTSQITFLL